MTTTALTTGHGEVIRLLDHARSGCRCCGTDEASLLRSLSEAGLETSATGVRNSRPLDRGRMLFRQGDAFRAVYVVRSGSLKSFVEDSDGDMQVLGFHLPGDIVGLSGFTNEHYSCSAQVLERSIVCELPHAQLLGAIDSAPAFHHQLMRVIGRKLAAEEEHLVMMGKHSALRRLAIFLRSLAERYGRLFRDGSAMTLSMQRYDIANYLGLVLETVSRGFSSMEAVGILAVNRKSVVILRPDLLDQLCDGVLETQRATGTV